MSSPEFSSAAAIYLVDDDGSFLTATSRLLRASGHEVETFSSASELLARLTPDSTGCVIADLSMPGLSGLELQEALAQARHSIPIIFLTGQGDIPSSVRAMRRGAEDFLTKRAPMQEILAAVQRALARDLRQRAQGQRVREVGARLAQLTPREREVLACVLQGRLNKEIANELAIGERTVKLHRTSIAAKLKTHSVAEWTRLVLEAGVTGGGREPNPSLH